MDAGNPWRGHLVMIRCVHRELTDVAAKMGIRLLCAYPGPHMLYLLRRKAFQPRA